MTRPHLERRNKKIFILVERHKIALKDVPSLMQARGFIVSYDLVRKIVSMMRRLNSQHFTKFHSQKLQKPLN